MVNKRIIIGFLAIGLYYCRSLLHIIFGAIGGGMAVILIQFYTVYNILAAECWSATT